MRVMIKTQPTWIPVDIHRQKVKAFKVYQGNNNDSRQNKTKCKGRESKTKD